MWIPLSLVVPAVFASNAASTLLFKVTMPSTEVFNADSVVEKEVFLGEEYQSVSKSHDGGSIAGGPGSLPGTHDSQSGCKVHIFQ
jgi:hypothetical protein